jgi:hypothetical protein
VWCSPWQCGVLYVDYACMPNSFHADLVPKYVCDGFGRGLLTAIRNGLTAMSESSQQSFSSFVQGRLKGVPASACTALRSAFAEDVSFTEVPQSRTLLAGRSQSKWMWRRRDVVSDEDVILLSLLPIYEVYPPLFDDTVASASQPTTFRALLGDPVHTQVALVAPPSIPRDIIGSAFIKPAGQQDLQLLSALGVQTVTEAEFYTQHVLPKPWSLPRRVLLLSATQVTSFRSRNTPSGVIKLDCACVWSDADPNGCHCWSRPEFHRVVGTVEICAHGRAPVHVTASRATV